MIEEGDTPAARPVWLTTLADLSLLLVGFFVFLQASRVAPAALAAGFRAAFDAPAAPALPVDVAAVRGFAPGSARLPEIAATAAWVREAARDPRTRLRVTGAVDGSAADVDPHTGSGAILAADRARAVAAALVRTHAIAPDRLAIATGRGGARVVLTLAFEPPAAPDRPASHGER